MDKTSILFAKFAGLQSSFKAITWDRLYRVFGSRVEPLIQQFGKFRNELIELIPELYSDMPIFELPTPLAKNENGDSIYSFKQIDPIIQSINYILEVRTNYRIGEKNINEERPNRIFISHGQSKE